MKYCTGCRKLLKLESFHKRIASKDGLNSRCILCVKEYKKKNWDKIYKKQCERKQKPEVKAKIKLYEKSEKYKQARKRYQLSEKGIIAKNRYLQSDKRKQTLKKYATAIMNNPKMYLQKRCRQKLADEIKKGNIRKRNTCEICHASPTQCHHDDYNKPSDFIELCMRCHKYLHSQYRSKAILI